MAELETVTLEGVEILSAGGPVHGVGSPPEGDWWSPDDLEAIAAANRDLAAEVKPPNKIGHSVAQALLENSGEKQPTPGEMPAVGWLDGATFRVEQRDGVAKLLADVRDVPKKFAQLLDAKAYRTRSVELSKVESQELTDDAGKPRVFEWVITGLAWLGAKLPAVRTLDDIVALYEDDDLAPATARVFMVYADGEIAWDVGAGYQAIRDDVRVALNGPATGGMNEPRFWVVDVATSLDKALVQDYMGDGETAWIIPFTRAADGAVSIAPSSDWITAEQAWVQTARDFEERVTVPERRADIRAQMSDKAYTDEQRRTFAEATGLEADKVTDEMLAAAGVPVETEEPPAKDLEAEKRARELEERVEKTERDLAEERKNLHEERRRNFVDGLVTAGKIKPGDREKWEKRYDENPSTARDYAEDLTPQDELLREFGADQGDPTEEEREAEERDYEADASSRLGLKKEAVI